MAFILNSNRSRSMSDICDETVNDEEKILESSFSENRYKTYLLKSFDRQKKSFLEKRKKEARSSERKDGAALQKSQSFVKKLITVLERKNEACKADDEFLAKYYGESDYLSPNLDCLQNPGNVSMNNFVSRGESVLNLKKKRNSNREMDKRYSKENINGTNNYGVRIVEPDVSGNDESNIYKSEKLEGESFWKISGRVKRKDKRFFGIASFDRARSEIDVQNRRDSLDSFVRIINRDDRRRNGLDRMLGNSRKEGATNGVTRRTSFKHFFGSVMKWKKAESTTRESPRRFMSYDQLNDQTMNFDLKNHKRLYKAASLQVMFENSSTQSTERRATIRPIYGGRRNETYLRNLVRRNKEDEKQAYGWERGTSCENLGY